MPSDAPDTSRAALEARARYYEEWAQDIRRHSGKSVDADYADATAATLRALAADRTDEDDDDCKDQARLWRRMFKPCAHDWRDVYGDEILQMAARSVCRQCGKRSQKLMECKDD